MNRYWLTPPDLYAKLNAEHHFDFDPCPCPVPIGWNALTMEHWGKSNFVNPPFRKDDGVDGRGPTAFVRKAIAEAAKGNRSVFLLPVPHYVCLLLDAGATAQSQGRVRWLEVDTREPWKSPRSIASFVLGGA
jgi:hypothetical protein